MTSNLPDYIDSNRRMWNRQSDDYERDHAADLARSGNAEGWGLWRIPETELNLLGDVEGKDTLEYGCGAARWSIALAKDGARPVGIDFSSRQLEHARDLMAQAGVDLRLIETNAEDVPLPDASFDIVFCDWGAMTFADPYKSVPEVSRLLRPDGIFVFSSHSPFQMVCLNMETDDLGRKLRQDYFGLWRLEWDDGEINFQLPYGTWIDLFGENGLRVERLIETQPPPGEQTSYRTAEQTEWARHWPTECIWKLRRDLRD